MSDTDSTFRKKKFDWEVALETEAIIRKIRVASVLHVGDSNTSTPFCLKGDSSIVAGKILQALEEEVSRLRIRAGVMPDA